MKNIKTISFICIISLFLFSCSTLKDGFQSQRKNSTDEFLVEKKRPLVMPPDFDKLPQPSQKESISQEENGQVEEIIKKNKTNQNNEINSNKNTENFILEKIKK
tara:strand:+ start:62 stop:373 length:312 start_codon:yes stop_codon:yes gene_type:complete